MILDRVNALILVQYEVSDYQPSLQIQTLLRDKMSRSLCLQKDHSVRLSAIARFLKNPTKPGIFCTSKMSCPRCRFWSFRCRFGHSLLSVTTPQYRPLHMGLQGPASRPLDTVGSKRFGYYQRHGSGLGMAAERPLGGVTIRPNVVAHEAHKAS